MSDKPAIYITGYGETGDAKLVTYRVALAVRQHDRETQITIPLAEPLADGEEGDATLRRALRDLAQAIEEVAGSPQRIFWHNRPQG